MSDFPVVRPIFGRFASSRVTPFHMNPTPASFASASELKRNRMNQVTPEGSAPNTLAIVQRNTPPLVLDSMPPAYEVL
jgi:hypothetical protein